MNVDVQNKINDLITQEQSLTQQLLTMQAQKSRLQNVLAIWVDCSNDPTFYTYVSQVTSDFQTVNPPPTASASSSTTQTTSNVAMETTSTTTTTSS